MGSGVLTDRKSVFLPHRVPSLTLWEMTTVSQNANNRSHRQEVRDVCLKGFRAESPQTHSCKHGGAVGGSDVSFIYSDRSFTKVFG